MKDISILIEDTPNVTIKKFTSSALLVNGGSYEYNNIDDAKDAPLVQELFYLPFVKRIFISANFIAIQRYDIVAWEDVEIEVQQKIESYLNNGGTVIKEKDTKKLAIEVYAESTPNPAVIKFGTNQVLTQIDAEFKNIEEANKVSPLAQALFSFPFVKEIFISENYISLTKFDVVEWNEVHQEVRNFIRNYLLEGKTIFSALPKQDTTTTTKVEVSTDLDETSAKIVTILNEHIKPAVASDGGNIAFKSYDEITKTVNVILQGACSGCPSSTATLKNGIEALLKEMLPNQINEVVAING